jgi:hypothetical protein
MSEHVCVRSWELVARHTRQPFFFSGSLHLRSRMHITTAVHSINTFCIFTKLLTTISMCIKHLNRHRHARISGYLLLTTLWCTAPPLHVQCIYIYMYLWLTLLVLCGSLTCTGLPIILCTVTRGNLGRGAIRDWVHYLSSALYTRGILKSLWVATRRSVYVLFTCQLQVSIVCCD